MLLGTAEGIRSWLRLPKLLRIRRVWLMIQARLGSTSTTAIFARLLCLVGFVLHYLACIWFGLGQLDIQRTWFKEHQEILCDAREKLASPARCDLLVDYGTQRNDEIMDKYLWALYWTTATMSGSGLVGEILPANFIEMSYTMSVLFLHLTMVAYVVGIIGNMVMNADSKIVALREEMLAVQSYISSKNLSPQLQSEVKAHIYATQSGNSIDMGWLFSALSYNLQVKLATNLSLRFLGKVLLFKSCSANFMDSLAVLLREETFSPEEYIFRCNEISREMYFVVSGYVENLNETEDGEVLDSLMKRGDPCGDLSFFFGIRQIYTARVQAAGSATLFKLQKREFAELLKLYPDEEHIIAFNALNVFDKATAKLGGSQTYDEGASGCHHSEAASTIKSNFGEIVGGKVAEAIKLLKVRRKCQRMNLLFEAIRRRDQADVHRRLNGGDILVNETNSNNRGALHVACSEGDLGIVKLLLETGADPQMVDVFGNTPLNDAVRHKHDDVAAYLRKKCGVTLNLNEIDAAVKMCDAAKAGNVDNIERMIKGGVDVNGGDYDGRTPLHLAAAEGHNEVLEYLLEVGADVGATDRFGGIPLEDAIRHGHLGAQQLLVKAGSKLESMSMACKMCEEAAEGKLSEIEVLVRSGVFPNIADYDARTALHLAASNDKNNVLYFLLKLEPKIDPNPVDRLGGTPLSDAIRHKNKVAQAQLKAAGGLEKGDPKLFSIQEAQKKRREDQEKEARIPRLQQMVKAAPENARLKKVQALCANLVDAVPVLCHNSQKLLDKMKKACELLEAETIQLAEPRSPVANDRRPSSPHSTLLEYDVSIESKSHVISVQDLVNMRDSAHQLTEDANSIVQHLYEPVSDSRVKMLQPEWLHVVLVVKEEARLVFAMSKMLELCHRHILKDVETEVAELKK